MAIGISVVAPPVTAQEPIPTNYIGERESLGAATTSPHYFLSTQPTPPAGAGSGRRIH